MLRLTEAQRELAAEKLADAGNLAIGALGFGQVLAGSFSWKLAALGLLIWSATLVGAVILREVPKWRR